ncbi:MAG: hypothetical protein BGO12_18440 [Verrucomicrobia bacterium 61-8]|nr:type III pantothenate kinase [Verrucomicrobiota bacterium]OJV13723.1 MAG: hypothetical protein BGO12_18440 [Verrucomicrobia bacterium 61-8]
MSQREFLLIDISNSFTKLAFSSRGRLGRIERIPTATLAAGTLRAAIGTRKFLHAAVASVVPGKNPEVEKALGSGICWVGAGVDLGIGIDYPQPRSIGADRLANAVGAKFLHGAPAIVVDFGTAVTFDVLTREGNYAGGVIAPGLNAMTDYLHSRTALLPKVKLREPRRAIGRSTKEAMQSGAVYGYRGLIKEIVREIEKEIGVRRGLRLIATGGDARLIAGQTHMFAAVEPQLTLEGIRIIATRNFPPGR